MFYNENTYIKMKASGKEDEFDKKYEEALESVKGYFGKEYPNIIINDVNEEKKIKDISPIDESELAEFQLASKESIERAIDILSSGYKKWFQVPYDARVNIIEKALRMLQERKFEFAALLTYENGKNRYEAMGDVDEAIDFMKYYSMSMIENHGFIKFTGKAYENEESMSFMKPYGLFAVISPFNFFSIGVGMTTGPLITGNAVLLKPSSDIPLSLYLFVRLLIEAGVNKDAIAFVSGTGSLIGDIITENKKVSGVVFTGSRDVGLRIFKNATKYGPKPVITEMGGKDAVIISDKADLKKAVEGCVRSSFGFAGQKCSASSLIYVHEKIYDEFIEKFVERTKSIKVGDPREKSTFMNPVVNKDAYEKYKKMCETYFKEGKILTGARIMDRKGYYVEPTVITDLKPDSYIVRNEIFLPAVAIIKVKSIDDAINDINSMDYGLTGGIFTEDPEEYQHYFESVDVGVVYANRAAGASTGAMVGSQPFVGWKLSGSTGKGTGSFYYLTQFLREQSITIAH
ncbi:aldehyde dehydrogenase family protein [Picrophilus oshimae]|uniref:L-glutamate gamma-semialdehyde dehydrogenase n=1 Tax=Picrophilus torridus (strain ATCC 700027 / DSM 9790 / JCM 10055 / NBRC 100828 / KAW 2/3) TaxID=1122961 RepID=A0A8G2FX26_PICTO|nr:aldehyde dehydrogenase family protein [Picrophilus oshimae]SMD31086.1 delta-1-pyrroline-5-carboxylate dehydrogenase [Picrophilus oshimae DSM 9789]